MIKLVRNSLPISVLAVTLGLAGCHKDNTTSQDSTDPAAANQASPDQSGAPGDNSAQQPAQSYAPPSSATPARRRRSTSEAMPPEPPADTASSSGGNQGQYANQYANPGNYDDGSYNQDQYAPAYQPVYATQPPPEIPVYEQPPCPGDNYIWTPGNWNYGDGGYYWVPGVWVLAPYRGALWTPGYWGYGGDRYAYHHGYWGDHIGFYGGIALGFGYFGHGFEGGYWNHDNFFYNRAVTHVNDNVRNVYVHNVTVNNVTINNYTTNNYTNNNINRVSYNGGRGGITAKPLPYEIAAAHEQHIAPLPQQLQYNRAAIMNRPGPGGKPQMLVASHPIQLPTRPTPAGLPTLSGRPAVPPQQFHAQQVAAHPAPTPIAQNSARPNTAQVARPMNQPNSTSRPAETHPLPTQQHPAIEARPAVQQPHPAVANQPHPETQQQVKPAEPARPAYQSRPAVQQPQQQHPAAQPRPQPQEQHSQPARPAAQPAARPEAVRPQPVRPQVQPQPQHAQPHQEARPAPETHPEPAHPAEHPHS